MKKILKIEIEGGEEHDLIYALDEVKRNIEAGFQAGQDSNEDGEYRFEIKGGE